MNEKKSNSTVVAVVAIVAIVLLVVPCLLGALLVGGAFMWRAVPVEGPPQEIIEPQPVPIPEPQVE